jgi:hypothetical protein
MGGRGIWVWIGSWWLVVTCPGQNLVFSDTAILSVVGSCPDSGCTLVKYRVTNSLGYSVSLTGMQFSNQGNGRSNGSISLLHHLACRSEVHLPGRCQVSNHLVHDLGILCYPDSLTLFRPDETILTSTAGWTVVRNCSLGVSTSLTTRLFNNYIYTDDTSGGQKETLSGAFCSPLRWSLSALTTWTIPDIGILNLGLSSARLTVVTNNRVLRGQAILFSTGVPAGKRHLLEYGLALQATIRRDFFQCVQWNCDISLFRSVDRKTDLSVRNLLGIRIGKYLNGSIQTRLLYEEEISRKVRVENMLTAGFIFQK